MATANSKFLFLYLLFIVVLCCSAKDYEHTKLQQAAEKLDAFHRELLINTIQHEFFNNPSVTTLPTTTVTNPVTTPSTNAPDTSTPAVVTVPSGNPVTGTPTPVTFPPATATPVTNPATPQVPVTNPVTTPSTGQPAGNPVTTAPAGGVPGTTPAVTPPATTSAPPATTNAPAAPGQSWCVAKSGAPEATVQAALDYACGHGADCSPIQQGASCYNPITLQNHASYAFNSYYQKNPAPTSCDFGGVAMITSSNPSSGSCTFPSSASSSTSPTMPSPVTNPTTPSPTTMNPTTPTPPASPNGATPNGFSSGSPPSVMNSSNPAFGGTGGTTIPAFGGGTTGFADSPQSMTSSMSKRLQPFISSVIMVSSIIMGTIVLHI